MREYTGPTSEIVHVAVVPGTPARLAAVDNTAVYLWDLNDPRPVAELRWEEDAWGNPVLSVSPDGRWLVAGPAEHLRVWDIATFPIRAQKPVDFRGLFRAEFVGEFEGLTVVGRLTTDETHSLRRFPWPVGTNRPWAAPVTGAPLVEFELPDDLADMVSKINTADGRRHTTLSADGSRFAFSGWHEKGVTVWDAATGRRLGRIPLKGTTSCLALSPDGSRLAVDGGTTVYVHDATSLELLTRWKTKYCYVPQLAWSPDGRLLGRVDRSTTTRLYDAATGRQVSALGPKRGRATAIAFAPDGLTYATGHRDGTVRVWDVSSE
jgi:WD40 repeat protein